jgi:eukaryotic-like serine/threonine-protein kinase
MSRLRLLAAGVALSFVAHGAAPNPANYEMALVDMQGQKKVLGTVATSAFAPRVSPDGTRVAFEQTDAPTADTPEVTRIYVAPLADLAKRKGTQVTVTARRNIAPVWSPDGDWLALLATGNGPDALYYQRSDGWIQPKFLVDGRAVEGWYENGQLVFITLTGNGDYGISEFNTRTNKVTRLIDLPGSAQHSSRISPDGKWIAYASTETGRQEVWLEPLPLTGKRTQLTREGGRHPLWAPDGKALYFDVGGSMYRMDLTLGSDPRASAPVKLPITGFQQGDLRRQYDLMPDGKAFLMLFPVAAAQ